MKEESEMTSAEKKGHGLPPFPRNRRTLVSEIPKAMYTVLHYSVLLYAVE